MPLQAIYFKLLKKAQRAWSKRKTTSELNLVNFTFKFNKYIIYRKTHKMYIL